MSNFSLQEYLLSSVRILRERGAAWVYLVYSEPGAVTEAFPEVSRASVRNW